MTRRQRSDAAPAGAAPAAVVAAWLLAAGPVWGGQSSLKKALAELKVPPDWFKSVQVRFDTTKPWKEAGEHIRKLLGDAATVREGMKLTCLYKQKGDIGDGHKYPLYLYLGGEYAWALVEFEKRLASKPQGRTHEYLCLASCYAHFGEYPKALQALNLALQRLPKPPWRIAREADVHDHLGALYAEMGKLPLAKQHYRKAMQLYPTSTQPWGRHLLRRYAARIREKLRILDLQSIRLDQLQDGTYSGTTFGYGGDITVNVTVKGKKIADIKVRHKEDIEQNATKIVPQRIIAAQSLKVDGITGATITSNAVIIGTFKALKRAGLK